MTPSSSDSTDAVGLGVLRAAITVLVIAFHVALCYHPFAPPALPSLTAAPFWQVFPVVDTDRWSGALWLVACCDTFFMSLMFLISGVFAWQSLHRKGAARHLRDRVRRLGLPFLVAAAVLAPLAYFPSYLQTGAPASWSGFWRQWLALPSWPAGPAWFLWLLVAYNAVAAAAYPWLRRGSGGLATAAECAGRRPLAAFAILIGASAAAYVPMALAFGPLDWTAVGPFAVQTSRAIHYGVYFAAGIAVGAAGIDRGLVAPTGALAARWPRWAIAATIAFAATIAIAARDFAAGGRGPWHVAGVLGFVAACAALSFALLAAFVRVPWPRARLLGSLRGNAYAMYVVHYAIVSWLLYALLGAALPAPAKAGIAFAGAVAGSWLVAAALRRIGRAVRAAPRLSTETWPSRRSPVYARSARGDGARRQPR